MAASRLEVSAPKIHEAPQQIEAAPLDESENEEMSSLSNIDENDLTEDNDVRMIYEESDANVAAIHEHVAAMVISEEENDENVAPNIRRSDRISERIQNKSLENSANVAAVPSIFKQSKRSATFEESK